MKPYMLLVAGVALAYAPVSAQAPRPAPAAVDKQLPNAYLPTNFSLYIGGRIFPPNYDVELQGDSLVYRAETYEGPVESPKVKKTSRVIKPTPDQWRQFWKAMDEIGLWAWKSDYDSPGLADGTHWGVEIGRVRKTIKSRGQNNYPGAVGRIEPGTTVRTYEESPTFKKYRSAVEALLGGAPFR